MVFGFFLSIGTTVYYASLGFYPTTIESEVTLALSLFGVTIFISSFLLSLIREESQELVEQE